MKANRYASGALLVLLSALAGCTMMQPPQPDPTDAKIAEIDRRLSALERILASGALTELTVQVDELQRDNAELRGRAESLEHDAQATASRQRDLYLDLDNRIQELERSLQARNIAADAGTADQLPVPDGNDRANYEAAFELLKQQQYSAAGAAFGQFLQTFPDSPLADNAQYWLAESSYVTNNFEQALSQFQVVLSDYPRSRKIPDALLKIGYSNYELGRWDGARSSLEMVLSSYPESTAARLAEQRLSRMSDEGH
jgi:tol-pal system protein YbgF